MAQTIKEKIVQQIAARIGETSGVKSVQRLGQGGVNLADVPTVIVTTGDDLLEDAQTAPYTTRRVEVVASLIVRQTDTTDTRSGDEILNTVGADIEKSVMTDQQAGGYAIQVYPPEWLEVVLETTVPHLGMALRFAVKYRHLRIDPYSN